MNEVDEMLIEYVRSGDEARLSSVLQEGTADPKLVLPHQDTDAGDATLLSLAAANGHHHLLPLLLKAGCPLEGTGSGSRTPLHYAVANGHQLVVRALLQEGTNIEAVSTRDDGGCPLHIGCRAGDTTVVRLLLENGADMMSRNRSGWTPLHIASCAGHTEIVKLLIESGANIEAKSPAQWRPLHRAAFYGHLEIVVTLLDAGADLEAEGSWGNRALHYAACRGHIDILNVLLERGCDVFAIDHKGGNALFSAAGSGRLHTLQWLLEQEVPVIRNVDNRTPADMAQLYGYHHVASYLHKVRPDVATWEHTQAGISLEEYDRIGCISLDWVKEGNATSISANFPSRPNRIHYQDQEGWTPLHYAAHHNQEDVIKVLLELGGLPTAKNYAGETPFDIAHRQGHTNLLPLLQVSLKDPSRSEKESLYSRLLHEISCTELKSVDGIVSTSKEKCGNKEDNYRNSTVKNVSDLILQGSPLEPVGGHTVNALHLAITTNCRDLIPLLLSVGAPLSTSTEGVHTLELAWTCPDVTTYTAAVVTRAFAHRIQHELSLVGNELIIDEDLRSGIRSLLQELKGKDPWRASWSADSHNSVHLTQLLERACRYGATLVASFIQRAGGSVATLGRSGLTSLHVALDAGQDSTVDALVRHLGANLFLKDDRGRLPLTMLTEDSRKRYLESAITHDYHMLDIRLQKARSATEQQNVQHVILLLAVLYSEFSLHSSEYCDERPVTSGENWKETFVEMAELLRQIYEENFANGDWLRCLMSKLNVIQNPEIQEYVIVEEESDESRAEVFFLLTEKIGILKTESKSQLNQSLYDDLIVTTLQRAFSCCCDSDMQFLLHLLITMSGDHIDKIVDPITKSTALHMAASHGNLGLCEYLLSHKASTRALDRANHTPAHIAYLFGHSAAGDYLLTDVENYRDKAGNYPKDLLVAYKQYMKTYSPVTELRLQSHEKNNVNALTKAHLEQLKQKLKGNILKAAEDLHVDFTKGEALEVQQALTEELTRIINELEKISPLLESELQVFGSSDNHCLYAPDEFHCNVVLKKINGFPSGGIKLELESLPQQLAALKGYKTSLSVSVTNEDLKDLLTGPDFINVYFTSLCKCLENFEPRDKRISIVLPGVTKTQVGANISFTWEGKDYPLLLIDVAMVPTLKAPWPHNQEKPPLIPPGLESVHICTTIDGDWHYSFASAEKMVLSTMSKNQRLVFLACKLLMTSLQTRTWVPKDVKNLLTYYDGHRFKIPAPARFILKAAFMYEMEEFMNDSFWEPSQLQERLISVFQRMCKTSTNSKTGETEFYHTQIKAYFGGDTEKSAIGLGAPEILYFLRSWKDLHYAGTSSDVIMSPSDTE